MTPGHRLLIVDDHPVFRRGVRTMVECLPWVDLVAEVATVADAVREASLQDISLVVMDIELRDDEGDGIDAAARIRRARPDIRILMLTMSEEPAVVRRALAAGARGYVLKHTEPANVINALQVVADGGTVFGPGIGPEAFEEVRTGPPAPFDQLSPRELEITRRLVAGDSNAQIARKLHLAEKTVRNQLSDIYSKIGVADRTQGALLASRAGIVP